MKKIISLLLVSVLASYVNASLKITEVYIGNSGDENATKDWIEITNFGSTAWDLETNPIYYNDSADLSTGAKKLKDLTMIAPGESVIYVFGDDGDVSDFQGIWNTSAQIGVTSGPNLSQNGDAVNLYTTNDEAVAAFESVSYGTIADSLLSTLVADAAGNWDNNNIIFAQAGVMGAYNSAEFEINPGEMATLAGSPGFAVPEPATMSLFAVAGLAALRRRR